MARISVSEHSRFSGLLRFRQKAERHDRVVPLNLVSQDTKQSQEIA